ncbi:MAG: porin [Rhodocyclales bacterium]|nr:porin [Rhodocyclales bacterium]
MQKKLIALAVAGLAAAPMFAQAQSNVTLYGRVDMSYVQATHDNKANSIDEESSNRWGLMGEEDIGGGLKAFFQLENRFFLDTGRLNGDTAATTSRAKDSTTLWKEVAQVGLKGSLGSLAGGRVRSALYTDTAFDAFGGDTIGTFATRRGRIVNNWDNAIRYESPKLGPVEITATFGPGETSSAGGTKGGQNRWGIATKTTVGGLKIDLGYQKDVNADYEESITSCGVTASATGVATAACIPYGYGGSWKTWNLQFYYKVGGLELSNLNAYSKGYATEPGAAAGANNSTNKKALRTLFAAKYTIGNGAIVGNIGRGWERTDRDTKAFGDYHSALGYWYNLSKRSLLLAEIAYDRKRDNFSTGPDGTAKDFAITTQLGFRHTF